MSAAQTVTAGLGIATGVTALFTFVASFWTARSSNQRQLRERFRKQLREMDLLCHVHFQREGWEAIHRPPQVGVQALDQIHQDGLISPCRSHLTRLNAIVRDLHGRARIQPPPEALSPERYADMTAENERRMQKGFDILDADTQKYLQVLGKMDNHGLGGYWTYLHYRFIPAREYVNR